MLSRQIQHSASAAVTAVVAEAFTVGAAVVVFTAGEEAAVFMAVVAVSMVAVVASTVEVALLAGVADFIGVAEDIVVAAPTGTRGRSAAPDLLAEGVTTEAEAMVADQRQAATEQAGVRTAGLVLRAA
ncbi:MAG: hypothetical protein ACXVZH_06175 [Terriglobales bacterium]